MRAASQRAVEALELALQTRELLADAALDLGEMALDLRFDLRLDRLA